MMRGPGRAEGQTSQQHTKRAAHDQVENAGMATLIRSGVAFLVGFASFVILVPTSGAGDRCFSLLTFQVPCESELALAAAAASAAVVGVVLWLVSRQRAT
jgi:hypothetical protein